MIARVLSRLGAAVALAAALAPPAAAAPPDGPAAVAAGVDRLLAEGNRGKGLKEAPPVEDLAFLRRASLDLIGRIPTDAEITKFLSLPAATRRQQTVTDLVARDAFADRWAVFYGDMLRVRAGTTGGAALQAFVHDAIATNVPHDELSRRLIAASGKANIHAEAGFILGDDADPMALTGILSQVFLGMRLSCAQCHDHPFDRWTREEFYNLAAFFGKTTQVEQRFKMRSLGFYINETAQTSILWPPEDKAKGKTRTAVKPTFPFEMDEADGPNKHLARFAALRAKQAAEVTAKVGAKSGSVDSLLDGVDTKTAGKKDPLDVLGETRNDTKKLNVTGDIYKQSALRKELAALVTSPKNRAFGRNFVNRVWAELLGVGFVNPVDDFRDDNPIHHAKALDFLADEFVASGYDFRGLVTAIVSTEAYRRGHLSADVPATARKEAEQGFVATPVRRMFSEAMFDSIVSAGHLFDVKHKPGDNPVTIVSYVQVAVGTIDDPKKTTTPKLGAGMPAMPAMMAGGGYDLERGIEVDFKKALKTKDDINVEAMQAKSKEELEAEMMAKNPDMMKPGQRKKYATKEVRTTIDDNPKFTSSMRIASPAPTGHFLRVFGQTDRGSLDERRDPTPSMRQALMMLNGKLTNEAARVGPLEPMHKLVAGPKADLDAAVKLAYREILTREPSAAEMGDAKAILASAGTPADGMADLRWALINCNEFRYLP